MGELKGQLLSILLVLVVFGAVAGALYTAFNSTKTKVVEKMNAEETTIKSNSSNVNGLLEFRA